MGFEHAVLGAEIADRMWPATAAAFGVLLLAACPVDVPLDNKACDTSGACASGFRCVSEVCVLDDARGRLDAACRQEEPACDEGLGCRDGTCRLVLTDAGVFDAGTTASRDAGPQDAGPLTPRLTWLTDPPFPAGASLPFRIDADGADPGARILIFTDLGTIETSIEVATSTFTIDLSLDEPPIDLWLRVPLSTPSGTEVTVTASPPFVEAVRITVSAPELTERTVGSATVALARGLTVDTPVVISPVERAIFQGQFRSIAFPAEGGGFPSGPYFGVVRPGQGPAVYRRDADRLVQFAISDAVNGPDESVNQIEQPPADSPYPAQLFLCASSAGGGDGVFAIESNGVFSGFSVFNNCNGMAFDPNRMLGDPGFASPMYVNVDATRIERIDPLGQREILYDRLPTISSGYRVIIPQQGWLAGQIVLLGSAFDESDSSTVWIVRDLGANTFAFPWLSTVPGLLSGGPIVDRFWGDVLVLAHGSTGEIRIYGEDGTIAVIGTGLSFPWTAYDPSTGALWIAERDRPAVLRIRPAPPE